MSDSDINFAELVRWIVKGGTLPDGFEFVAPYWATITGCSTITRRLTYLQVSEPHIEGDEKEEEDVSPGFTSGTAKYNEEFALSIATACGVINNEFIKCVRDGPGDQKCINVALLAEKICRETRDW